MAELRDRRAAAEAARVAAAAARLQEQRDRERVDLAVDGSWSGEGSYEPDTDRVAWELQLSVRNNGPRNVDVVAVELPGVQLTAPAAVSAGQESGLRLAGHHSCTDDPVGPGPTSLPVEVRTEAGPLRVSLNIYDAVLDTRQYVISCDQGRAAALAGQPAG
jgi:hypothetical protein